MVPPMAEFVRDGKPLAPKSGAVIYCDDGLIAAAHDMSLAALQGPKANCRADMIRNRQKIDFFRFCYTQFLEKKFSVRKLH